MDRATLRDRILEYVSVYQDDGRAYLRFNPVEGAVFRHGLSLNVATDDIERTRNAVADYLAAAFDVLTRETP
jgi:hypothetical protein